MVLYICFLLWSFFQWPTGIPQPHGTFSLDGLICWLHFLGAPDFLGFLKGHIYFPKHILLIPSPNAREEVSGYLQMHLICWQNLTHRCQQKGLKLFRLRPKHHSIDHLQMDIRRNLLNPARSMQCFTDESFLGHIKRIGIRCHCVSMMQRLLQRYVLLLSLRWRDSRGNRSLPISNTGIRFWPEKKLRWVHL